MRSLFFNLLGLSFVSIAVLLSSCSQDSNDAVINNPVGTANTISLTYGASNTPFIAGPKNAVLDLYTPTEGIHAEIRGDSLRISSVSGKYAFIMSVLVKKGVVGTYPINYKVATFQPGNSNKCYFGETTRIRSNQSTNEGTLNLIITSIDSSRKVINGTFTGTMNWDGSIYGISNGKLSDVTYERQAAIPINQMPGTLQLQVGDSIWVAETVTAAMRGSDTLAIFAQRNRSSLNTSETFQMLYPLKATKTGYYTIDVDTISRARNSKYLFFGTYQTLQDITGAPDNNLVGYFNILEYNTSPKYVTISFNFSTRCYGTVTNVTNGTGFRIPIL